MYYYISNVGINIWATAWQNQQNGMCVQQRLRSAWTSTQSYLSLHCPHISFRSLATHWPHSEDFDQTWRMTMLIWVFAGLHAILLVLSWGGSTLCCFFFSYHIYPRFWDTLTLYFTSHNTWATPFDYLLLFRIYPKYWDILSTYHTCPKIWNSPFYYFLLIAACMANSVDPDQTHSAASDLGLHCLQRPICPNTWSYYSTFFS